MITLRSTAAVIGTINLLADNQLRALLTERAKQLSEWESYDLAHFLIIQPGDTATDAEKALGWSLLVNPVDGARYGHPDFTPFWEWAGHHDGWYELVFVFSDDGFGVTVLVQDHPDVDAELLAMCRTA